MLNSKSVLLIKKYGIQESICPRFIFVRFAIAVCKGIKGSRIEKNTMPYISTQLGQI